MARLRVPSLLESRLKESRAQGRGLLIPFFTGCYPSEVGFLSGMRAAVAAGADAIEVGVPFSDPLADGPTIQRTSQRALEAGVTLEGILDLLAGLAPGLGAPIVIMTYANPIHAMGLSAFCARAAASGVSGLLVSDLPPEELPELGSRLREAGLDRIVLIAPTTRPERCGTLLRHASGFVYCITRTGVTGAGAGFSESLAEQVAWIRARSDLPIVAGFGVRTAGDVERLKGIADGVVIGAKLLEVLEAASGIEDLEAAVVRFLTPIRRALDPA